MTLSTAGGAEAGADRGHIPSCKDTSKPAVTTHRPAEPPAPRRVQGGVSHDTAGANAV